MIQPELKELRDRRGWSLDTAGALIGCSGEAFRRKEMLPGTPRHIPITGQELALLARAAELPLHIAFPSYRPTHGEQVLAEELAQAA